MGHNCMGHNCMKHNCMSHVKDEGEEMYNGFKNILEKVKSAKDLEKFIGQPDKSKYQYASKVAYMYLKWVTIGWEDYINDADPDEVWDEYMSNINFDQFSDYCEEFDDLLHKYQNITKMTDRRIDKICKLLLSRINKLERIIESK